MAAYKILLYLSNKLKDDRFPVYLRVTNNRKSKYYTLDFKCTADQWDDESSRFNEKYPKHKKHNRLLLKHDSLVSEILENFRISGREFTFKAFEMAIGRGDKKTTVFDLFDDIINEQQKHNTKGVYRQARNALRDFEPSNKLMFHDIDYTFLTKYEKHLFKKGNSGGGVHFQMRHLRAATNEAIRRGILSRELYPFSSHPNDDKYSLKDLKSKARPRALSAIDMDKIKNFPFEEHRKLKQYVYYFLFSYYARGINFIDMAELKKSDIYDNRINYNRSKSNGNFSIPLSDRLAEIVDYFNVDDSAFIFPILSDFHKTDAQIKNRVKKCLRQYNKGLKEVAGVLDIKVKLTSYVSRHTYAMTLRRKGKGDNVISKGMGHSDVKVTKAYLDQFEDPELDKSDDLL